MLDIEPPSHKRITDKIETLRLEIEWNINRLGYLVMSDEDREQTEDMIRELRDEQRSLEWCLNGNPL
jgi:hypothetical protein